MNLYLLLGTSIIVTLSFGQTDSSKCASKMDTLTKSEVYLFVDKMPEVEGGMQVLFKELLKLEYPKDPGCVSGKIYLAFIVGADGKLSGKRVLRNPSGSTMGNQALVLVDNVKWIPGSCKGINVPVLVHLPINIHPK